MPRPASDRAAIETEIVRVRSLGLDGLRTLWRVTLRSCPPPAFTKDLMARFLCWHIQEQARGGLDPETAKHLDGLARGGKPGADRPRRLKPGTVLLREYQGERHTVTVVPNGYVWRETTYASLSTIARAITGTAWSGPRFFGLRSNAESTALPEAANVSPAPFRPLAEITAFDPPRAIHFRVKNPWFTGAVDVPTFSREEMLATKLWALLQRDKGRDLFDLAHALDEFEGLDAARLVTCFGAYLEQSGQALTRAQAQVRMFAKLANPRFLTDMRPLLPP
jgi:hypothetical protein